jgi:fibronectin-binding autotransporter adhesin
MKPKTTLRNLLALAGSSILALSSASAQTTYTWTQTATGDQDWTTAGNWDVNGVFSSGAVNELRFFADTTTSSDLGGGTGGESQVVINVPTSLSMNTLTLNGRGPNSDLGSSITIGTSASTWTIGDGTTSTVNLNSALGGGGANRDLRYTIGANLTPTGGTGGITTFTGASTSGYGATFSGDITGTGKGITKSGTSLLVFSGNNSYTGTTLVSGGVLRLSSANALSGGIGTTGGTSALTINGGVVELGATDFSRGLGSGSSQFEITGGSSGFSAHGGSRVVTVNGDASEELVWGSTHFAPATLVLNQAYGFNVNVAPYANGSIELTNKIDLNGATRTVQVNANKALLSGDIRTTSGTAGLTKTGAGTLVLTGNNTYNGDTTISGGTLSVGTDSNFSSGSSGLVIGAGTLQITGTALTSISDLGPAVTFNTGSNKGFDIHNAANIFTVDQVLNQGTGTLTKSGVGTLVLNQNNTFTGATTVTGGGKLVLDYTTNNGSKLSDTQTAATALTLTGGALVLKGGSHNEVIGTTGGTTVTTYTSNSISRDGGSSTISLGPLALGTNSSLGISEANLATTTSANVNGILTSGRVTVGSNFGANDGSNNIVAYSAYTTATIEGVGSLTAVNQLTGGGTMGANLSSYALRIVNSSNDDVLDLGTNRQLLLSNGSTLLYAGGSNNNYTINGSGTSAVSSTNGNQPFIINTFGGTTLTINARTSINGGNVSKAGAGTLVLGGNNISLGANNAGLAGLFVQEGVVRVTNNNALGSTTSGTTVLGGAALELANDITIGAEALSLNGAGIYDGSSYRGALRNQSGSNSWAGAITIGASGARINSDAISSLTLTGGIATTAIQDVTFGGAGATTVSTTAISGSGGLIKDGAGTVTLSATNTYTGATTISGGTLAITGATQATNAITFTAGSLGLDTGFPVTASSADVDLTNGTIKVTGTTGASSYTLLTAASITGTPVLAAPVSGYELQIAAGGTQLRLVDTGGASPYDTWSGGALFDSDANGDGVSNGLAFLLGASGPNVSALGKLPAVTESAGGLVLSFQMLDSTARGGATLAIEHSNTLATGSWTTVAVPDSSTTVGDVVFTVTGTGPLNVTATIPVSKAAGGKLFGRLKGVNP